MSFLHKLNHIFNPVIPLGFADLSGTVQQYTGTDNQKHRGLICGDCGKLLSGPVPMAPTMKQALDIHGARATLYHMCKKDGDCVKRRLKEEGFTD